MKYYCNPINFSYKYQFNKQQDGTIVASREAADPSMILFKDRYYIFPSMTCGFIYSDDLANWQFHPLNDMPVYDYAPDVRVVGESIYFCASNHDQGVFYRTRDPFSDQYERIEGAFPFWDPDFFVDDDGRLYFYWGSSVSEPLYGIELNRDTFAPIGEKVELFCADPERLGFERTGEDHIPERSQAERDAFLQQLEQSNLPPSLRASARAFILGLPYVEGAWMSRHNGKYYLQYGTPGSRFNIYGDGVYVSDSPLGTFTLAANNPFSYKPGGFMPGAGHGSTMEDRHGNLWHTATMRICVNHNFERRIGLWPAGWDADGELYCNQRFGDWPQRSVEGKIDPWADPEWMLLSFNKKVCVSSSADDHPAENAVNEDVRSWWKAAADQPGEWLEVDLGDTRDVHAIHINFADDHLVPPIPPEAEMMGTLGQMRWIDEKQQATRWQLEGSIDGQAYFVIEDKRQTNTDLPHDLVVREEGFQARFIRLTVEELPYHQTACVSGLRVFGLAHGERPAQASDVRLTRIGDLDLKVEWQGKATGYVVNWGHRADKLYHSYQVFANSVNIGALVKGQDVYVRVDSFNESGIVMGETHQVKSEG